MSRLISVHIDPKDPIIEPVTLQDAKDFLRLDFNDEDDLIESLITSARQKCERFLGLCLVDSEVSASYRGGGDLLELAYSNIKKDDNKKYIIDGDYEIRGAGWQKWIATIIQDVDLKYTSGFDEVPEWAKVGVLKQIAWDYENRGDELEYNKIAPETMAALQPYRTTLHEFIL